MRVVRVAVEKKGKIRFESGSNGSGRGGVSINILYIRARIALVFFFLFSIKALCKKSEGTLQHCQNCHSEICEKIGISGGVGCVR